MKNSLKQTLRETSELAQGLQNSNYTEVAELAKGFLALEASYHELKYRYTKEIAEKFLAEIGEE